MSRIIKFRAWDSKNGIMRDWDYLLTHWSLNHILEGDPNTEIMQFTGLKDKSGVEVYEGDLLWDGLYNQATGKKIVGEVKWQHAHYFIYPNIYTSGSFGTPKEKEPVEVIGNIYEDEKLLK